MEKINEKNLWDRLKAVNVEIKKIKEAKKKICKSVKNYTKISL